MKDKHTIMDQHHTRKWTRVFIMCYIQLSVINASTSYTKYNHKMNWSLLLE